MIQAVDFQPIPTALGQGTRNSSLRNGLIGGQCHGSLNSSLQSRGSSRLDYVACHTYLYVRCHPFYPYCLESHIPQ